MSILSLIVAAAENGVIGRGNQLPWHLPGDLKWFKAKTLGKPVVMGRKTFQSIGKPLPGRPNIVVTRDRSFAAEGITVAHSLQDGLHQAESLLDGGDEVMVIGGAEIFRECLPLARRLYLTEVHAEVEGDVYLPEIDRGQWRETFRERHDDGALPYSFVVLERA
ncbi:dihydrofolate reductase [Telmatospirillum sp. J64-1]|uniref:dihydrofolate reductase n=1 Tax=Telmatospirillum sp. J64-1 TaxID=2502183 RepID=UPI00115D413C|nr:dihydrofolate reductase [Telmatospirillum sp. J64-1]